MVKLIEKAKIAAAIEKEREEKEQLLIAERDRQRF
jgi:hypothetical protein